MSRVDKVVGRAMRGHWGSVKKESGEERLDQPRQISPELAIRET
jgi:hypothetical protein